MTVPAILCDALPCSKPKKSRHMPTVFPNNGSALNTSAITVATMSCPQKARGARQIQARRPFNDGEKRAEQ